MRSARTDGPSDTIRDPKPRQQPVILSGIVNCLRQAEGGIVSRAELIECLYGEREDGGPLGPQKVVDQLLHNLRKRGFPIETVHGRGYRWRWRVWEVAGDVAAAE